MQNSNRNVISVGPGGVGLPDRIMFLKMQIKKENFNVTAKMLGFLGEKPAEAKIHAEQILHLKSQCQNQGLTV
jgi:endothelin-converting enzyme/putative endopeptidase